MSGALIRSVGAKTASSGVASAKWRIEVTVCNDATYFGTNQLLFCGVAGATSQPGTGTATSSTAAAGSATATCPGPGDFATAFAAGYLEFDFDSPQSIVEIFYQPRSSFTSQSPRELVVKYWDGAAFQQAALIPGIPTWTTAGRRFAVPYPGDEPGGYQWVRINVSAAFSGSLWSAINIGFIDSGVDINNQYNAVLATGGFNSPQNLFVPQTTGDAIGFSAGLPAYAGVNFGRKRALSAITVTARSNPSFLSQTPKTFTVEGSNNNWSTFTTLGSFDEGGGAPTANQLRTYTL